MKNQSYLNKIWFICLLFSSIHLNAQVKLISTDSLLHMVRSPKDSSTIVINFWATWCKPCVQELPYFIEADSLLKSKNIQFIFVSFDGEDGLKKVKKYVSVKHLPGTHYLFDSYDFNELITSVGGWEGNIPYTILLKNGTRKNHEINFSSLKQLLKFIEK